MCKNDMHARSRRVGVCVCVCDGCCGCYHRGLNAGCGCINGDIYIYGRCCGRMWLMGQWWVYVVGCGRHPQLFTLVHTRAPALAYTSALSVRIAIHSRRNARVCVLCGNKLDICVHATRPHCWPRWQCLALVNPTPLWLCGCTR